MKVFLKYISKNMVEKKGRLFLLLFSIAISTALLVGCVGIIDVIIDSFSKPYFEASEKDICIVSGGESPYLGIDEIDSAGLKNISGELQITGIMNKDEKIRYISIRGREQYEGHMTDGESSFLFESSSSCIISKRTADEFGLKVGDELALFINGEENSFKINGIAADEKLFYADSSTNFNMIVPYSYLDTKFEAGGKYNRIMADLDGGKGKDFVKDFNAANSEYEAIFMKDVESMGIDEINTMLYCMMTIVVIVSSIIIHGAFKLIITERLPIIGTFMSQGATKKKVEGIILLESLMYALIGGALGCVLGEVLLFFVGRFTSPLAEYGIYSDFAINPTALIAGMIFAVVLSLASAYSPVRAIRKLETKDVILNRTESISKKGKIKFIAGLLFLAMAIAVYFINDSVINITAMLGFLFAYIGMIMITPALVKMVSAFFRRVFKGNTVTYLAMNNIHSSKLLRNNVVLIVVSLSSVLLIASFGKSMVDVVNDAYSKCRYDYNISGILANADGSQTTSEMIIEKLNSIPEVVKDSINPEASLLAEADGEQVYVMAVNPAGFKKAMDEYFEFTKKYNEEYEAFEEASDNTVMLPEKVAKKINKKKGDTVVIDINSKKVDFKVAGVFDAKVYNNGIVTLMHLDDAKREYNVREVDQIYFSTSDNSEKTEKQFKAFLANLGATYTTREEDTRINNENNAVIVNVMAVFSYLAMVIASIGVFNNITISFHQRKKEFAVMASLGMDIKKRKKLILLESLYSVLFAILLSLPFTYLLCDLMTGAAYFIEMPMIVAFSWSRVPLYAAVITVIILIATLSTIKNSRKLSIVKELKYE